MNGSTMAELIDAHFEEIMSDFIGEKEYGTLSQKEEDKIAKTEEFYQYAEQWISSEILIAKGPPNNGGPFCVVLIPGIGPLLNRSDRLDHLLVEGGFGLEREPKSIFGARLPTDRIVSTADTRTFHADHLPLEIFARHDSNFFFLRLSEGYRYI